MSMFDQVMPCARVRIVFEGDYPVALGDEDAYPGCATVEECVLQDIQTIQEGNWDILEMVGCLVNDTDSVEIVG